MRATALIYFLFLALLSPVLAEAPLKPDAATEIGATATTPASEPTSTTSDAVVGGTVFNGQEVPPMRELSGETLDQEISKGYWLIEFYSPYCHHCKALAPVWQTLYEFYYTSKPVSAAQQNADSLNSFTRYYNFKFAKLDCVAFGTACSDKRIHNFPTIILFKDGEGVKKLIGVKTLAQLSEWVEETLETIRPGSRPPRGETKLPKVGAHEAEGFDATKLDIPSKPKEAPNVAGTSVPLTAEAFQKLVTTTRDPWFVKFYAPWCSHCQAMAPNWQEMAREMKGKLNIGEVNCDVEKRLCKDAKVKGYPTLLYFRAGERVEYDGLRGVGDLISFAKRAVDTGSGVIDVDAESFAKMEETEEVIFVYFYDHATTSEDFQALDRLTLSLIGHGKLVKTKDPKMAERFKISTWPRLMVSRDGKPSYYTYLAPKDMRDFRKVLNWMKTVWLPIVPELTASNSREIMDGKLVVLGILSRNRADEFVVDKREIKNAALEWIDKQTHAFQLERQELRDAKQLRIEEAEDRNDQRALRAAKSIRINMDEIERKEVGFAWVDGVFWERWIRTTYGIDVKEGHKVVINDEDNRRYWDTTITGNPIVPSRTSILETLSKVVQNPPKISPKSTTSSVEQFFFGLRNVWSNHPWLAFAALVGCVLSLALWGRGKIARRGRSFGSDTGGYFQLDGEKGLFSGNGGSGKVD